MSYFQKLREKFSRFMYGRYGTDSLNRFLTVLWLFFAILNAVLHSFLLYIFEFILCFFVFFRMLSRNFVKRRKENATYYQLSAKVKGAFRHFAVRIRERKTTRFFHCPHCKAPIRMPRKIGKFNIRCTKCGQTFQKEFKN